MDLHFIQSPICARTGVPLPFDLGPESVSLSAMRFPPAYDRARSALIYNGTARQLMHKFKFHNRPEIADLPTPWLETCGQDLLKDADYLIPVPLHLFLLSVVVIINQRNWLERCQNQAVSL
jgi:predicted amidophosphoribosyltransferase